VVRRADHAVEARLVQAQLLEEHHAINLVELRDSASIAAHTGTTSAPSVSASFCTTSR